MAEEKHTKTLAIHFRLTDAEHAKLKRLAREDERSIAQFIRSIVRKQLRLTAFEYPKAVERPNGSAIG